MEIAIAYNEGIKEVFKKGIRNTIYHSKPPFLKISFNLYVMRSCYCSFHAQVFFRT